MSEPVRLRIAPSPTGAVHLGLARTALFNWAFARGRGGGLVLRIEDTDRDRSTEASERAILEGLAWLGIDWDEGPDVGGERGPYRQSERLEGHLTLARRLCEQGNAYRCFCSTERLDALRAAQQARKATPRYDGHCRDLDPEESAARVAAGEPHTLRFRVPEGRTEFTDLVRGAVGFDNAEVDDWVMVRTDGSPTYNFVVVGDDADMGITHVLRGEEHLVNTPKQLLLYRAMELEPPLFGHLPLLLGKNRKKLSKRDGSVSLEDYRREGYPQEAIVNFLCLQGWALDGLTEVFSVEQFVEHFDVRDVSKGGAVFDFDKFLWLAGEYVHQEPVERLVERTLPFVVAAGLVGEEELRGRGDWFTRVVALEQERIRLYSELPGRIAFYFAPDDAVEYEPKAERKARKRPDPPGTLADFRDWLAGRDLGDSAALGAAARTWLEERGLALPDLFMPLRLALTGKGGGPDLFEMAQLLGRERILARIEAGIRRLG